MATADADVSKTKAWLMAARPQTLPAGSAPVVVGAGLAVHDGVFAWLPAVAALVGALLIQVGTNFANDYYDAVNGADTGTARGSPGSPRAASSHPNESNSRWSRRTLSPSSSASTSSPSAACPSSLSD